MSDDKLTRFGLHLILMQRIHNRKSEDYAAPTDKFANYHRQAEVLSWFECPADAALASRIAEKLSRLATLLNKEYHAYLAGQSKPAPANESIVDTFLDLCTIANIWWCDYEDGYGLANHDSGDKAGVQEASPGVSAPEGGNISDKRGEVGTGDRGTPQEEVSAGGGTPAPALSISEVTQLTTTVVTIGDAIRKLPYLTDYEREWLIKIIQSR